MELTERLSALASEWSMAKSKATSMLASLVGKAMSKMARVPDYGL